MWLPYLLHFVIFHFLTRGMVRWWDLASISLRLVDDGMWLPYLSRWLSYVRFGNIWMRKNTYLFFRLCLLLYIRALQIPFSSFFSFASPRCHSVFSRTHLPHLTQYISLQFSLTSHLLLSFTLYSPSSPTLIPLLSFAYFLPLPHPPSHFYYITSPPP